MVFALVRKKNTCKTLDKEDKHGPFIEGYIY